MKRYILICLIADRNASSFDDVVLINFDVVVPPTDDDVIDWKYACWIGRFILPSFLVDEY